MTNVFPIVEKSENSLPIHIVSGDSYTEWLKRQPAIIKNWLKATAYKPTVGNYSILPAKDGSMAGVIYIIDEAPHIWSLAHLATQLPEHIYHLQGQFSTEACTHIALGWALAGYAFTRYKKNTKTIATLVAPKNCDMAYVISMASAMGWARDLINTPANDMHPNALANEAATWGRKHKAKVTVIKGEELLAANYPLIYTVGKASTIPPHLVDIFFARKGAPKITLVGKGVCFDSGGLDLKSGSNMKLMKKDMGGAACVLALAKVIIDMKLPVQLRVLLPIVENAVAGNAMRPSDIALSRKGITVEIGNTDAEGRLILCDALSEADDGQPDLLIDCATLTGAARVALGTEIPAFFTQDDKLADALMKHSNAQKDPLWRLPLWKNYRSQLDTPLADISNDPDSAMGGAITAALYLQEFVSKTASWLHIDMMAWNPSSKPGRPQGGEAMAVRALYALLKENYGSR